MLRSFSRPIRSVAIALALIGTGAGASAAAAAPYVDVHTVVDLGGTLEFGEYFWDEEGAPAKGAIRVVVDLNAEQMYVYRGGFEIARTRITRGWDKHVTPTGIFPILQKDADHYSSTYDNAPMPYTLRLTWDGVAIHGADVDSTGATHGCIGVPLEFAQKLFANVKLGTKIFVTKDWMLSAYSHQDNSVATIDVETTDPDIFN